MKIQKLQYIILVFLVHITISINAQTHNWVRTNPGGGGAFSTVGASASGIIIAGSDLSGAYRSNNGGQAWSIIGIDDGLTETHVSGVGFHRTNGNMLFIGTENGMFKSTDGGNTVNKVLDNGYITDIEFGTNVNTTGYATYHPMYNSNNGVIYKSTNAGDTWSQSSINLPSGIRVLKIIVNPNNVNTVYILTGQGRFACGPAKVYRSLDGGINWSNITTSFSEILDIAIDTNNPDTIYITTMNATCPVNPEDPYWTDLIGGIYKSTDGGTNWSTQLSDYTGIILLDQANANTIHLIDVREPFSWILRAGTYTSTDGGSTFTKTGNIDNWDTFFNLDIFHSYSSSYNGIAKTIGEDLSNSNTFFWVNYQWIFKTTNNGNTFNNIFTDEVSTGFWRSRGFDNVNMMDVTISDANTDLIYAAYFDIGLWRSLDKGESWQSCNKIDFTGNWQGNGGNCATVLADPENANVVWASMSPNQQGQAPTYLIKSTNTGERSSWNLSNTGLPNEEIMGLSLDKTSSQSNRTLYVTALGDVYKSTNGGVNWSMNYNCNGCRFTAIDQFNGNIVYAGGENGLWRTMDGGTNWQNVSHVEMPTTGIPFWGDPDVDGDYDGVFDVKTDPNNPNWVYVTAVGTGKGLYKSINNGTTWEKLLTDDFMRKIGITPQNSNILYATSSSAFEAGGYDSNSNGIWYSENGGQSWIQQNQNMEFPFGLAIDIDNTTNPTVIVGSPGTGFQKSLVSFTSLSVEENEHVSNMKFSPNPFNNQFTIHNNNPNYSIKIFNSVGQKIIRFTQVNGNKEIDTKSLKSGIYFVQIRNNKYTSTYKVIKL